MVPMRAVLLALLLSALVACGGDADSDPQPEAAPTTADTAESPSPSPTPTVAKVSDATMCTMLIDDKPSPFGRAVDVMQKEYAPADNAEALEVADELASLAERATSPVLEQHVAAMAAELRAIFEDGKETTADFVASATEVNNVCGNTTRF